MTMAVKKSDRDKLYEMLCERTGLPSGTDGDIVVGAYVGAWRARAVAAGLSADATVPDIVVAEAKARDASRLSAALRAAGSVGNKHANGVKMLTAEEAQDVLAFGCHDRVTRRRAEATEEALGKSLREALEAGELR